MIYFSEFSKTKNFRTLPSRSDRHFLVFTRLSFANWNNKFFTDIQAYVKTAGSLPEINTLQELIQFLHNEFAAVFHGRKNGQIVDLAR